MVGQPTTVNVTVAVQAPGSGTATGTVLVGNGVDSCTVTLAGGAGSCELTPTAPGQPDLSAAYSGDDNFNPSGGDFAGPAVAKANSTLVLSSSDLNSIYGQPVHFIAVVGAAAPGFGGPTGGVQFYINGAPFGPPVTLAGGTAESGPVSDLTVGSYIISAAYSGDSNFNPSLAADITQQVDKADTTTVLISQLNPSPYGTPVTVVATVAAVPPSLAVPVGSVQLIVDGVDYGAAVELVNGEASKILPYTALWVGNHTITAVYSGAAQFHPSDNLADPLIQQVVDGETIISSVSSIAPTVYGQAVHFTINVAPNPYTPIYPSGTITVSVDGVQLGGVLTLDATGRATTPDTQWLAAGYHVLTVAYSGDEQYGANTVDLLNAHRVFRANSDITAFSFDPAALVVGLPTTVYDSSSGAVAPGSGTATGTVLVGNGVDSCTVTLAGGAGSCELTPTAPGQPDLSAAYSGDDNFNPSGGDFAGPAVIKADTAITGFEFDPAALVVGQPTTVNVTVAVQAPGSGTATGTVLVGNGVDSCTVTLAGGAGSCELTPTAPGQPDLSAAYSGDDNFNPSNDNLAGPVVIKADTAITGFEFDPAALVVGQPTTVNVTVAVQAPGSGTATGTVLVGNGVDSCTVTLAGGAGSCELTPTAPGQPDLSAAYSGDDNFNPSGGNFAGPSVIKADTAITGFEFDPAALVVGQPTTVNVTVAVQAPGSGTATGTVLVGNGVDSCTVTLAGGAGSCELTPTAPGQPDLSAAYSGDDNFNPSGGDFAGPAVIKADTAITGFEFDPAALVVGQPTTVNVTVAVQAPGSGTATGTVLVGNGVDSCTVTLAGGAGSCELTPTAPGQPDLSAAYSGDDNFNPSGGDFAGPAVIKADTTMFVTSSDLSSFYGQPVHFTAQVDITAPGAGTLAGTVQFYLNGAVFGAPVPVSGGLADSMSVANLVEGPYTVYAAYSDDGNFNSTVSEEITQEVFKTDTTTVVVSQLNPSPYGNSVTVVATVAAVSPSLAVPVGSVQFIVDGVNYGDPVFLDANGQAEKELHYTALWVGDHTVTAVYSGAAQFNSSNNLAAPLIQQVTNGNTVISAAASAAPSVFGQPVTFTITVAPNPFTVIKPSGTVVVWVDGVQLGGALTLNASGQAVTAQVSLLAVGAHTIAVDYSGDERFAANSATLVDAHQVEKANTALTNLLIDPMALVVSQPVTVSLVVEASAPGAGMPSGTVEIGNGVESCTITLVNGAGACQFTPSLPGQPDLVVAYSGDANFIASSLSAIAGPSVSKASTSISALTFDPISLVVGQPATVNVTVSTPFTGAGAPSGAVEVSNGVDSCTVTLINGAGACQLAPSSVGQPDLSAAYSGDTIFNASAGDFAGPLVAKADTAITNFAFNPTSLVVGQSATISLTVEAQAPGAGAPSGAVEVSNGVDSCTVTLVNGAGACQLAPSSFGQPDLSAAYSGDTIFNASAGDFAGPLVAKADTAITNFAFNPTSLVVGQSATISLTVEVQAPGAGAPSGAVEVSNGVDNCTVTLVNGAGACQFVPSASGQPDLSAAYPGDANFNPSSLTAIPGPTVGQSNSQTTITGFDPASVVVGQPYLVSVSVAALAPAETIPDGSVEISNGSDSCTALLVGAVGSCEITPSAAGQPELQALYSGDSNFSSSADTFAGPLVVKANTAITNFEFSPASLVVGQSLTISLTVEAQAPGAGIPGGTVEVSAGVDSCTMTLAGGAGSCELVPSAPGQPDLMAAYPGDANFNPSSLNDVSGLDVSKADTLTTIILVNPTEPVVGQPFMVSVQVAAASPGTGTPAGTVTVSYGAATCEAALAAGAGYCQITPAHAGQQALKASYPGNDSYNASQSSLGVSLEVDKAATLVVISGPAAGPIGQAAQWTAMVGVASPGAGLPSGQAQFYLDGVAFGAPIDLVNGQALSESASTLELGAHQVSAVYRGNDDFLESTSPVWAYLVSAYKMYLPILIR